MRRDMNLIELLLLQAEGEEQVSLDDYSDEQILRHQNLLKESGLAHVLVHTGDDKIYAAEITGLTSKGHEFLARARENSAVSDQNDLLEYNLDLQEQKLTVHPSTHSLRDPASSASPLKLRTELISILTDRFNESELKTLCSYLGVEYDDLPPGGKPDKARELVSYLKRRHCIPELIKIGMKHRSDIAWPDPSHYIEEDTHLNVSRTDTSKTEANTVNDLDSLIRLLEESFQGMAKCLNVVTAALKSADQVMRQGIEEISTITEEVGEIGALADYLKQNAVWFRSISAEQLQKAIDDTRHRVNQIHHRTALHILASAQKIEKILPLYRESWENYKKVVTNINVIEEKDLVRVRESMQNDFEALEGTWSAILLRYEKQKKLLGQNRELDRAIKKDIQVFEELTALSEERLVFLMDTIAQLNQ